MQISEDIKIVKSVMYTMNSIWRKVAAVGECEYQRPQHRLKKCELSLHFELHRLVRCVVAEARVQAVAQCVPKLKRIESHL